MRPSFNQGSRVRFPAGSQRIVNLFGAVCLVRITGKSKWGGRRSVRYNILAQSKQTRETLGPVAKFWCSARRAGLWQQGGDAECRIVVENLRIKYIPCIGTHLLNE